MTLNSSALRRVLSAAIFCWLSFAGWAGAQSNRMIEAGTTIVVRTSEDIYGSNSDGRIYAGVVDQNVPNKGGGLAIPRGAEVELLVRDIGPNQVSLDLDSIVINGQHYGVESQEAVVSSSTSQAPGLGNNQRTAKFVGGGAIIGAIIGAISNGGKGAAIGGGVGAAAGAGAQVMTRGGGVNIPAESLVTFRLQQPLQTVAADNGYSRYGQHYHQGNNRPSPGTGAAYQAGLQAGTDDAQRNARPNPRTRRWTGAQQLRDYEAGYNTGYDGYLNDAWQIDSSVNVGRDRFVSWHGPAGGKLYAQVDNKPWQLFASGDSGRQTAPWITPGHLYVFVLQDRRGNEVARDQIDLRGRR